MSIPGSLTPLFNSGGGAGYQVSRSIRLNASDSAFLSRTPASAGNRKTWTWSGWVKRSSLTAVEEHLWIAGVGQTTDTTYQRIYFDSNNKLRVSAYNFHFRITTQVFRDFSAWFHLVVAVDTTQATANNRVRVYVNGAEVTAFDTINNPAQNDDTGTNSTALHYIGAEAGPIRLFNGYLADVHLIDGQQLTPSSFAETNATTGQWVPKAYTGSYGTNGFKLSFSNNASTTTISQDSSGNNNHWTSNNIRVSLTGQNTYTGASNYLDKALDGIFGNSSTQNVAYTATFTTPIPYNSLSVVYGNMANSSLGNPASGAVLSVNGSTVSATSTYGVSPYTTTYHKIYTTNTPGTLTSLGMSAGVGGSHESGIYEVYVNGSLLISYGPSENDTGAGGDVRGNYCTWNPLANSATLTNGNLDCANGAASWQTALSTIAVSSGKWFAELTLTTHSVTNAGIHFGIAATSYSPAAGNYLGNTSTSYAYRSVVGEATGSKVNSNSFTSYGAVSTQGDVVGLALDLDAGTLTFYKNGVSQGQAFSGISGTFVIALSVYNAAGSINFGQRPFAFPVSGFKALCDQNLPAPTIAKPSTVMDVKLYTGNGSTQTISGLGFSPDLVWVKCRVGTRNHVLSDTIRGANNVLASNTTAAQVSPAVNGQISAFNSDGFAVAAGTSDALETNNLNDTYTAWTWDAGSSTVTNTQGSITSQVRANASAGFSIVTWTAPASGVYSFGHGLGVAPRMVIMKDRGSGGTLWCVYHASVTSNDQALALNQTAAISSYPGIWGAGVTSTVVGSTANMGIVPSSPAVAYCFAPVAGYSAFGSYTGNGSADGPFVYTGFRPRWILFKNSSVGVEDWWLHDTARNTYNVMTSLLVPNTSNAEGTNVAHSVDALSNGFKIRTTAQGVNGSGHTIVYAAFAENPFQYSRAR
jgi:hypothetical protein